MRVATYKTDNQQGPTIQHRELYFVKTYKGKESEKGLYIYIYIYIYIHTHTHTHLCICMYIHIRASQWKRICLLMQETQEMQFQSLGQESPLEEEMATRFSILAWKNPMDREDSWGTVHRVAKSWPGLSHWEQYTHTYI